MNAIDAVLGIVVLLGALIGARRGFIVSMLALLALASSLLLAFYAYRHVAGWIEGFAPQLGLWDVPLAFVGTFIAAHLLLSAVAGAVIRAFPRAVHAAGANRVLGVAPGAASGLINATVLALVLLAIPLGDALARLAQDSELARRLAPAAEWIEAGLSPIFDPAVRRTLQAVTVPAESRTGVALRFKVANPAVRSELEARMLEMVNAERARHRLKPLQPDPELAEVARAHSRDMLARGFFSHVDPQGRDASDRMRQAQLRFLTAGENLALAPTLAGAHQGLMNSPGHRANLLRPQFGRAGIGVLDAGRHGLMITQKFRN